MNRKLTAEYVVLSTVINAASGIHLSYLQGMMQDAASRHAQLLGLGHSALERQELTFMLSRLSVKLHRPGPYAGEVFSLETWPRSVERLLTTRDFVGRNSKGQIFLTASSGWLLVDTRKMKIIRPQQALGHLKLHPIAAMEEAFAVPAWIDDAVYTERRQARFTDLDVNQHVNNTRYTDWILDALASALGTQFRVVDLAVNFISEVKFGEVVDVSLTRAGSDCFVIQGKSGHRNFSARARAVAV